MTKKEFARELMSNSDLGRITFSMFDKMIKESEVVLKISGELSIHLYKYY